MDLFGTTITNGQAYVRSVLWPLWLTNLRDAWQYLRDVTAAVHERAPGAAATVSPSPLTRRIHARGWGAPVHV